MVSYKSMGAQELKKEIEGLEKRYADLKSCNYNLNMARGKPCKEQLDLSNYMVENQNPKEYKDGSGFDLRNYGILDGISEAKALFGEILGLSSENVIVGGNSSLNLMYDTLAKAMLFGVADSVKPWSCEEKVKFLCPVPGYDRHFGVTQDLGIEMICVPMTPEGPDMDFVEKAVKEDESIKGIWCVPLYSNPDGITYSQETCERLAGMETAAQDFTIMWDNAYCVHHLDFDDIDSIPEIVYLCAKQNNPNRVFEFASTSKITWAGAGISCIASSKENIKYIKSHMKYQTIGSDKPNQLRHVKFLKNAEGIKELMKKHAQIIGPKFQKVFEIMKKELSGTDIAEWNEPKGGYFISLFVPDYTAAKIVAMAKECGVELTPAGATYPYGKDPQDNNIRIAPTFPGPDELEKAIEILCVCIKLVSARKFLEKK